MHDRPNPMLCEFDDWTPLPTHTPLEWYNSLAGYAPGTTLSSLHASAKVWKINFNKKYEYLQVVNLRVDP
jgi:hypothetical protein